SLDVSGWDTSQVTDMSHMFAGVSVLTSLDVSHFDTSNVQDMTAMFRESSGLTSLDVSGWDMSHVTSMYSMFDVMPGLRSLRLGPRTYFDGTSAFSGLSGRWTQVDPAPVPGACYVNGGDLNGGDQASCSTTDPDFGLFRPAPGEPGQVRTGAVTYGLNGYKAASTITFRYVDDKGNPVPQDVVSKLGLPGSKSGNQGDPFEFSLPDGAGWKFTGCDPSSAASCTATKITGTFPGSDTTVTVKMVRKTAGKVSFEYVGEDGKPLAKAVAASMPAASPAGAFVGSHVSVPVAPGYLFDRVDQGSTGASVVQGGKSVSVVMGEQARTVKLVVKTDASVPSRRAGKVSFEYVGEDGKPLAKAVAASMPAASPAGALVGSHVSVPVAPGYLFDSVSEVPSVFSGVSQTPAGVTVAQDGKSVSVVMGEQARTLRFKLKSDASDSSRLAGKVSFEYVSEDGSVLPSDVVASMPASSPADALVGSRMSVPVASGYVFSGVAPGSTGVKVADDKKSVSVVLGREARTVKLIVKSTSGDSGNGGNTGNGG
ncbi:BspA family leucine-rich repeat surface protein, partial [Bifidobacterium bombi]|uniref:BspA family leucine-rich repeat surface protein n=1 Tax=Bifidobacterium bombi TaxID=471511 RepID=UPI0005C60D2E